MTIQIELESIHGTGKTVGLSHFGGNTIFTRNTSSGIPELSYAEAIDQLDIGTLRFPAGMPDLTYKDGLLINGELPRHLLNFMDWAVSVNRSVVIVTPTFESYTSASDLYVFSRKLSEKYGEYIKAFEIGNDYFAKQDEFEYGRIADESILAVHAARTESGQDFEIWSQMANPTGRSSAFGSSGQSFEDRVLQANLAIADGLSAEAREAIDGVVEKYYFNKSSKTPLEFDHATNYIGQDFDIWKNILGDDISLNITEWNVKSSNYENLGMRAASTLVAQLEYMMLLDVDAAYVWPPQHNTTNDLAGAEKVIVDDVSGLVVNSIGGATFDLMSTSLVGLELMNPTLAVIAPEITTHAYADDNTLVVFIASQSKNAKSISFDIGGLFGSAKLISAVKIGYSVKSSDGKYYSSRDGEFVAAELVKVDNNDYYLNEHDVEAEIRYLDTNDFLTDKSVSIDLLPYQLLQLEYDIGPVGVSELDRYAETSRALNRTNTDDRSADHHLLNGGPENDEVKGGSGNDTLSGGAGDDFLDGGMGNDVAGGGLGDDTVSGGDGDDVPFGAEGDDNVWGGLGDDTLAGGNDDDVLAGACGDDQIFAGAGDDTVYAAGGDDEIHLGKGSNVVFGGPGADRFVFYPGASKTEIADFEDAIDLIDLSAFGLAGFAGVRLSVSGHGTMAEIEIGTTTITLHGLDAATLEAENFVF